MDATEYVKELTSTPLFQELLALKKTINDKYASLIIKMKNKEALFLEAKEHEAYYQNFNEIRAEFVSAKKELYSKSEVQRYFVIERNIQQMLDDDMNELKRAISNKFLEKQNILL